jgi:hypothetical protein
VAVDRPMAFTILDALHGIGAPAGLLGGMAVSVLCPSAAPDGPFARDYKDIDLATRGSHSARVAKCLEELGFLPDAHFNALHGQERLYFWHEPGQFQLDVFVDQFRLCHTLPLDRAISHEATIDPAMLLMTKLQIVEANEKDLVDAAALLHDLYPDGLRLETVDRLVADDWGLWRTATGTLEKIEAWAGGVGEPGRRAAAAARSLRERWQALPKSMRWRLRARVGDRVRWYEEPEEEAHG